MRLIDADALKKAMDRYWGTCQRIRKPRNGETAVFLDIKAIVEDCPTIDAVPAIRCKECKFWSGRCAINYSNNEGMAETIKCGENEFCCWAERKEE